MKLKEIPSFKQTFVIHLGEDRQLAVHSGIDDLTASLLVGFPRQSVGQLRSFQVGQLPAEAFAKVTGVKVVGVISL
ncbi:hypothetical protein SDC9_181877 [bioreactor metagenome]|uniref:Uncharacterized protein n=1 Tax=bioreactor metagenome TaxID=1076179 RepID=A0A645HE58_9ZZZZ